MPSQTRIGPLPAAEIEAAVLTQVQAVLQQPEMLIAIWKSTQAMSGGHTFDEAQAVIALRQMGAVWDQLFPVEQHRIVRLLIARVALRPDGLDIVWHDEGWRGFGTDITEHPFVQEQRLKADELAWEAS